jgi:superfamily II DNA helicase RecQ
VEQIVHRQLRSATTYVKIENIVLEVSLLKGICYIIVHNSDLIYSQRNRSCGIIYCRTREATEEVATYLTHKGIRTAAYHAGSVVTISQV